MFEQLNQLQKNVLKNEFDAKEIKAQSDLVRNAANNAHDGAVKVTFNTIFEWVCDNSNIYVISVEEQLPSSQWIIDR